MSSSRTRGPRAPATIGPNDPEVVELHAFMTNTVDGEKFGKAAFAAPDRDVPSLVASAARAYQRTHGTPGESLFSPEVRAALSRRILAEKERAKVNRRRPARTKRNCGTMKQNARKAPRVPVDVVFEVDRHGVIAKLRSKLVARNDPRFPAVHSVLGPWGLWNPRVGYWTFPSRNMAPEDIALLSSRLAELGLHAKVVDTSSKPNVRRLTHPQPPQPHLPFGFDILMQKADAVAQFEEYVVPQIRRSDPSQRQQAWDTMIADLIRQGRAPQSASRWTAPRKEHR